MRGRVTSQGDPPALKPASSVPDLPAPGLSSERLQLGPNRGEDHVEHFCPSVAVEVLCGESNRSVVLIRIVFYHYRSFRYEVHGCPREIHSTHLLNLKLPGLNTHSQQFK